MQFLWRCKWSEMLTQLWTKREALTFRLFGAKMRLMYVNARYNNVTGNTCTWSKANTTPTAINGHHRPTLNSSTGSSPINHQLMSWKKMCMAEWFGQTTARKGLRCALRYDYFFRKENHISEKNSPGALLDLLSGHPSNWFQMFFKNLRWEKLWLGGCFLCVDANFADAFIAAPQSPNEAACRVHFYNAWQGSTTWDRHSNPYFCVNISPKVDPRVQLRPLMNATDIVSVIILKFLLNAFYFNS